MNKVGRTKILVAMSGGVDSSVAAYLLKKEGYTLCGVFMKLFNSQKSKIGRCCTLNDSLDAKRVCDILDIPFITVDFREIFNSEVIDNFVSEYEKARTPNPCIKCNQMIKFNYLLKYAIQSGFDGLATGHYARIEKNNNSFSLYKGVDKKKDQSYFLFTLTRDILASIYFPVGSYPKEEIRKIAEKANLPVYTKKESQEICFVEESKYFELFKKMGIADKVGEIRGPGDKTLGQHDGITHFTIGQRKGLKIAYGKPLYVRKIDINKNIVYLDEKDKLLKEELNMSECNWIENINENRFTGFAQIRYNNKPEIATIDVKDTKYARVKFHKPRYAITPGQACVISNKDGKILGGGWID